MKTSVKLIWSITGFAIFMFLVGLVVLRKDVQTMHLKESKTKYKLVQTENFESLHFSENWIVKIKQGKACQVELEDTSISQPIIKITNGSLYLKHDSSGGSLHARITLPNLNSIQAGPGTSIKMDDYETQSLSIMLDDKCSFSGKNNDIKKISIKTYGEVQLELIKD